MYNSFYDVLIEVKDIVVGVRHGYIKNFYEFNEIFSILDANIGKLSDKKRYKSMKRNILRNKMNSNDFLMFLNKELEIAKNNRNNTRLSD